MFPFASVNCGEISCGLLEAESTARTFFRLISFQLNPVEFGSCTLTDAVSIHEKLYDPDGFESQIGPRFVHTTVEPSVVICPVVAFHDGRDDPVVPDVVTD